MTTDLERWWVQRAHRILTDWRHLNDVANAGGSPAMDELDGHDLRWPGYLGRRYGQGLRVLALGNVHRGFRSHGFNPGPPRPFQPRYRPELGEAVDHAITATRLLQAHGGPLDDSSADAYLDGVRPMYAFGMSGSWKVGNTFASAWKATGIDKTPAGLETVAYVNVSCCQVPEDEKLLNDSDVKVDVNELCSAAHPLAGGDPASDIFARLQPDVVVTCAKEAWQCLARATVPSQVLTVFFDQRLGSHPLSTDVSFDGLSIDAGTHMNEWREEVNRYLKTRGAVI